MANRIHPVTIKGVKEGLVLLLSDQVGFEELLDDLRNKLEHTHQQILTGPLVHVFVKLGSRKITPEQEEQIRQLIRTSGNLIVRSIETDDPPPPASRPWHMVKGLVRSGQTLEVEGDLFYIGDVNPGGMVKATGSIYILGSLKGIAHAGADGDEQAIIAASLMTPMQLRIAGVISRPPDEWADTEDPYMEFAYLRNGAMEIDKLTHLYRIRPDANLSWPQAAPAKPESLAPRPETGGASAEAAAGKGE